MAKPNRVARANRGPACPPDAARQFESASSAPSRRGGKAVRHLSHSALLMFSAPGVSEKLVKMFAIEKKSELEKYCTDLVIAQEELVQLILWSPLIGYYHLRRHKEYQPAEAHLTDRDMEALRKGNPALRAQRLPTVLNKIRNLFHVTKYVSAHLFVSQSRWHLFYYSSQDTDHDSDNHWRHGSHVHFVNDLWPHYRPEVLDDLLFSQRKIKIFDSMHIRFKRLERRRESHEA